MFSEHWLAKQLAYGRILEFLGSVPNVNRGLEGEAITESNQLIATQLNLLVNVIYDILWTPVPWESAW